MQHTIGKRLALWVLFPTFLLASYSHSSYALQFQLPPAPNAVIGAVKQVSAQEGDTLGVVGQREDIGYVEMAEANPGMDPDRVLGSGATVNVPSSYVLPDAPRRGIVINLAELRLYYFPPKSNTVITFPVGIGREGWETPEGATRIGSKEKDPVWYPTAAVRADAASQGYYLPKSVPAGPDNPLGRYSLRIASTTYLIHSTNKPEGVGRRSSAGCMRMYPDDAEYLYKHVAVGTPVYIVNQPYKAGWQGNQLYLEAHMPLQEQQVNDGSDNAPLVQEVLRVARQRNYKIDWQTVRKVAEEQSGLPTVIGRELIGNETLSESESSDSNIQQFNLMNQINSAMNVVAPVKRAAETLHAETKHLINNYFNDYAEENVKPKRMIQQKKQAAELAQKEATPAPLPKSVAEQSKATSKAIIQSQRESQKRLASRAPESTKEESIAADVNSLGTLSAKIQQGGDIVIMQN